MTDKRTSQHEGQPEPTPVFVNGAPQGTLRKPTGAQIGRILRWTVGLPFAYHDTYVAQQRRRGNSPGHGTTVAMIVLGVMFYGTIVGIISSRLGGPGSEPRASGSTAVQPTSTPDLPQRVKISGRIDTIQSVGVPVDTTLTILNTGADLSDVVLDATGCTDHWVLDSITTGGTPPIKSATAQYYELGSLNTHEETDVTLTLVPKDSGNHVCDFAVWNGMDSTLGTPNGSPIDGVTKSVAINP